MGEFNGDGRLDLVVANHGESSVSVRLGNGNGTFAARQNLAVGQAPSCVVVADFNEDGRRDLAVTVGWNADRCNVDVLLGNGNGTFQAPRSFPISDNPYFLTVGEFNGDGRLDLAVAATNCGIVSVHLGKGDGTFTTPREFPVGDAGPSAVADLDADGRLDLAVTNNDFISVLLGNGDGTFEPKRDFAVGSPDRAYGARSVVVGDFNGDGWLDLVTANGLSNNVSVLLGNGNGTFQPARQFAAGPGPYHIVAADFNDDGCLDVAVANEGSFGEFDDGSASLLLGNGDGTFQAARNFAGDQPLAVAAADVNRDGRVDLLAANAGTFPDYRNSHVIVLLGNGDGTFQAPHHVPTGIYPTSLAVHDFNGDGRLDFAVPNKGSDCVSVHLGNGDGTFQGARDFFASSPDALTVGDVNRDGLLDFAVSSLTVRVLLGNGDGTFRSSHVSYVSAGFPYVSLGDFNGDNLLDGVSGSWDVSILINDGNWKTKAWIGPASGGDWFNPVNWSPAGVPTVGDAVLISDSAVGLSNSVSIGELYLTGAATVTVTHHGNHVLRTTTLSIGGSAMLNLNDNALILDYSGDTPVAYIRDYLVSGRNGGAWDGAGINSGAAAPGTGLGFAEASDMFSAFPASFGEQSVDATSILVRYTLLGDATLDGKVDVADLGILVTNWQQSPRRWSQGDFNYDGTVDIADLGLLATTWQQGLASPAAAAPFKAGARHNRAPRLIDRLESDATVLPV
jgi:hypothetical protein